MQAAPKASFAYAVEAAGDKAGRTMRIPVIIDGDDDDDARAARPPPHRGVFVGSLMSFLAVSGAAVTFPFAQARRDALGCDALCVGGQTSPSGSRSRARARRPRVRPFRAVPMLWLGLAASCASLAINAGRRRSRVWVALVPAALLNQNFSVLKALFSDYTAEAGGTDADRAARSAGSAWRSASRSWPARSSRRCSWPTTSARCRARPRRARVEPLAGRLPGAARGAAAGRGRRAPTGGADGLCAAPVRARRRGALLARGS